MKKLKWYISIFFLLSLLLTVTAYADEQNEETAWITASLYEDGSILFDGTTSATMTAKVPYFDLGKYDLADYVLKDENGEVIRKPTLLHGIIYLIEEYSLQGDGEKIGTGYYKDRIFKEKMTGNLQYYKEDGSKGAIVQTGGTMLSINEDGKVISLWGFDDMEIRIYLNQKQQRKQLHEILLEDLNVVELMLLSKEEERDILYPRFWSNTHQIQVGESVDMYVSFYDIYGKSYSWSGGTALYMVRHMDNLEKMDVNIDTSSGIGKWTVGPFRHVGIYKAKAIFYPFYYKQLIEVRDSITEISLKNDEGVHYSVSKKILSKEKKEITVIPDAFYDIAENVKIKLDDTDGTIISREKRGDGSLVVLVSYPKDSEESDGNGGNHTGDNLNNTDNGIASKPEGSEKTDVDKNQNESSQNKNDQTPMNPNQSETKVPAQTKVTATKAPAFSSAKRSKNGKTITLKWKKVSGATGYVIQMSTKSKTGFKNIKTVSAKTRSITKKNLKKSKTYYFRMRTYKTVKGKKFYSKWSKVKKVK